VNHDPYGKTSIGKNPFHFQTAFDIYNPDNTTKKKG
jgi:hypothetical protein